MKKLVYAFAALAMATSLSSHAEAAGFYIQEQSVSGLGASFAGSTAAPRDASIIYYNPAGMTYLDGTQGNIGIHVLAPFSDTDDTGTSNAGLGQPRGGDSDNPYGIEPVPNLFLSHQYNDVTWFGVGVTAPFGLKNDYDDDWFARYDSTSTELLTVNVQPSVAVKLTDNLSLGAGLDVQYVDAELKSAVFAGAGTEGTSTLSGDDISFGYNFGLMAELWDDTRLGVHYRSQVNHMLDGESVVEGTGTVRDGTTQAKANLNLPEMVSLGVTHDLDDQWTLLGGLTWFGWSNYERITATADSGTQLLDQAQNYKNTWAVNIGAEYVYSSEWTFRGGLQYDETPTQDGFRSTRTPDGDRTWVSGSATYTMDDQWSWDFAATYIHVAEEDIDLRRNAGGSVIDAESNGHVGIVALGLNYKF